MSGQDLVVTLIHALPGRLRLRLSAPPRDVAGFLNAITAHEGLDQAHYTPLTRSVLIHYETGHLTTEEILLRAAMALSVDAGHEPVLALSTPGNEVMTDGAILAGLGLAVAGAGRWLLKTGSDSWLDRGAGVAVALAVLQHVWIEVRQRGAIHAEVLTLGYLALAFVRANPLRGALLTWAASFGRHLLTESQRGIETRPLRPSSGDDGPRQYQIRNVMRPPRHAPLLATTQALMHSLGMVIGSDQGAMLMEDLRRVAKEHGEVLEGLGGMRQQGIPLIFR